MFILTRTFSELVRDLEDLSKELYQSEGSTKRLALVNSALFYLKKAQKIKISQKGLLKEDPEPPKAA